MATINLKQNFARILRTLEGQGLKPTNIAKSIGYTTTAQLNSALAGDSLLSTKAIMGLVENLKVNPIYLFLGKGDMFLTDETEIDKLRKENQELTQRLEESGKMIAELREVIKILEKRNADLIDMSVAAIKFHTEQKKDQQTDSGSERFPISLVNKVLEQSDLKMHENNEKNLTESGSSLKRNKK